MFAEDLNFLSVWHLLLVLAALRFGGFRLKISLRFTPAVVVGRKIISDSHSSPDKGTPT